MCGFIVSAAGAAPFERFVSRRGPDFEGTFIHGGLFFRHYQLHVTGHVLRQPIIDGPLVCLFNGEIYSQDFVVSDGEIILPLYRRYGPEFAKHLDGEYAIAIYDFAEEKITFATDPFGTKPLSTSGILCSSYSSAVGGTTMSPNTTLVRNFDGGTLSHTHNRMFDFQHQEKPLFDDWIAAFRKAVRKRAKEGCYIGLSSGYDSGAIACELHQIGIGFKSYSFSENEDLQTLLARRNIVGGEWLSVDDQSYAKEKAFLEANCEPYDYHANAGIQLRYQSIYQDPGAIGASLIHRRARGEGRKVFLSGQGADEILSDYSKTPSLSHFQGCFPEKLYKWPNFDGLCQRAYLSKEEMIAGAHGVEGRYPFLDSDLVQEFLWLSPVRKNEAYKAPLREYFRVTEFPIWEGQKRGFNILPDGVLLGSDCGISAKYSS